MAWRPRREASGPTSSLRRATPDDYETGRSLEKGAAARAAVLIPRATSSGATTILTTNLILGNGSFRAFHRCKRGSAASSEPYLVSSILVVKPIYTELLSWRSPRPHLLTTLQAREAVQRPDPDHLLKVACHVLFHPAFVALG